MEEEKEWDLIIEPKVKWYNLNLAAILKYKDLIFLLVRRDFVAIYKQTILGPIWLFIQPIFTSITFAFIFGRAAKIGTDGSPKVLFYMSGIILWGYFADCLNKTSNTFIANAGVFGKVYFPRLVVPLSILISNLFKFGIQLLILTIFWGYYLLFEESIYPKWEYFWMIPFLILMMAGFGFGFGILISSLTTKYRDLTFLIGFGMQLLMYASSVVLPLSYMSPKIQKIMLFNPFVSIIETFKYILTGNGTFAPYYLFYGFGLIILVVSIAIVVFNKVEKSFMDTV